MQQHDIWFDGELVPFEKATVHVLSHVLHYGSSVFEGIRCYDTDDGPAIFRLPEHLQRLADSAKIHRMQIPHDLDALTEACIDTVATSGLGACYLRPLVFRGQGPMGVNPLNNPVVTIIAVWAWGKYLGDEALEEGVDVQVSSWNRNAPNTMPSLAKAGGNYLNASLIKMEAIRNGYSEGIALSPNGLLSEGSGENLFLVRSGRIYTPPTGLSVLPGITRDSVITLARERGYTIEEKLIPREALYIADEIFFTGTAAEVTPVRSVDKIAIGRGRRGPITEELQAAYLDAVHGRSDHTDWLTPVPAREAEAAPATNGAAHEPAV